VSATDRITQRNMTWAVLSNLQRNLTSMQDLQQQLSSGKRLNRPSDGPGDTVTALQYRRDIRAAEQLGRNAQNGLDWLGTSDTTVTDVLSSVGRIRTLMLQGVNGSVGPTERQAIAKEIETLRDGLVSLANTTYMDQPIFAGSVTGTVAYTTSYAVPGDASTWQVTYQGTADVISRKVAPGVEVRVNLTGPEIFGTDAAGLFAAVQSAINHLNASDSSGVSADLATLDSLTGAVKNSLATVGARYNQIETMRSRMEALTRDRTNGLAEVESIDLPETITKLQLQEVAYKAALAASARTVQPSLVDFLS
jgi:flagellar hook-associated protein 3 FlgL